MSAYGFDLPTIATVSAALRRAEGERDAIGVKLVEALRENEHLRGDFTRVRAERDQANELTDKIAAELRGVTKERDALARRLAVRFEALQELTRQRNLANADLATARTEVEQLRAQVRRGVDYAGNLGELACPDPAAHTTTDHTEGAPMSAIEPGPAVDLIEHAADIIVAKMREPHTAPYHWAGALWEAGMLVAPGTPTALIDEGEGPLT